MDRSQLQLLQGTLDMLVLQALAREPDHGYGVARWIRHTTDGELEIEEGALYTALHRMEKRGWLKATWGVSENNRRAKFYALSPAGRKAMQRDTLTWRRYVSAVFRVLDAAGGQPASPEGVHG
ncbi:MAG: PadR family transcriptional regulator [Gemmatimonadota bacterium]